MYHRPFFILYNGTITTRREVSCIVWKKIKAEYIAGGTSYRKLAEKYGVSETTLKRTAKKEKWVELRTQVETETTTKIAETVSNDQAKKAVDLNDIADILADRIKTLAVKADDADTIKKLTSAAKDIRDIKGIKTDADLREQEARIRKLEQETKEQRDMKITVEIKDGLEGWSE